MASMWSWGESKYEMNYILGKPIQIHHKHTKVAILDLEIHFLLPL